MGRKPRVEIPGGIYHVTARRVDRWRLFVDDDDYQRYLQLLAGAVERFAWSCCSFCLMPNHVHLLIQIPEENLAKGMHWLQARYVRWFNDRHSRTGRLFEHRYHASLVEDELYFLTAVNYIEMNPVSAALCDRPEDWPWSSRGVVKSGASPKWLAELKDGAWHRL